MKADELKAENTENMKEMNNLFAHLINNNSPPRNAKRACKLSSLDKLIQGEMMPLIQKIITVIRENLFRIIETKDGLYCMLFIQNCIQVLMTNEVEDSQAILDHIW